MYCQIGIVLMIAMAAKNAILVVEFARGEREKGLSLAEAALNGAHERFRPIMMTSLAFIFAMIPLATAQGAGAAGQQVLGTAVLGGMITATLFNNLFVPPFYVILQSFSDWLGRKTGGGAAPDRDWCPSGEGAGVTYVRSMCAIGRRGQLGLHGRMPWEGNRGEEYVADVQRFWRSNARPRHPGGSDHRPLDTPLCPRRPDHRRAALRRDARGGAEPPSRPGGLDRRRPAGLAAWARLIQHWDITRLPYDGEADRWVTRPGSPRAEVSPPRSPVLRPSWDGTALNAMFVSLLTRVSEERGMKIGTIGAGNIGAALARRFTAAGHEVSVANSRGPESLAALAAETGANAVMAHEAARAGEVVVMTIPLKNVSNLPRDLFAGVSDNVVVIDTANYYPQQRDGKITAIEDVSHREPVVEWQLGRKVVKVFNNIYAKHLQEHGRPEGRPAGSLCRWRATMLPPRPR